MQDIDRTTILKDYRLANLSRQLSLVGRKEVLNGKAKFGIFGDGKEIAQIAMAKFFRDGDWRTGYYRDQTFMLAAGLLTPVEFFSQLYGDTDMENNPQCGGRIMNNHFSTRSLDDSGAWKNLMKQKNSSADFSPTAGHMPRMLGCAYASKIFRNNKELWGLEDFTDKGNEVVFGTIGDASTSEGYFWESLNAAAVLQVPMALAIWDDGYGISVPTIYQTARGDLSRLLEGFVDKEGNGILLYQEKGWNYEGLIDMFKDGIEKCRKSHKPVVFHVKEMTQPQGHSSSGSHERYKSEERLAWEKEWDPVKKFREWIVDNNIATEEELFELEGEAFEEVQESKKRAWKMFTDPIKEERKELVERIYLKSCNCDKISYIDKIVAELQQIQAPLRRDVVSSAKKILRYICKECSTKRSLKAELISWLENVENDARHRYDSYLYSETMERASLVKAVAPVYPVTKQQITGREILNENFDTIFASNPLVLTFGEDTGFIGDVNRCLEGLQEKYGELRITDTGIREASIMGQGIGLALRGLRPIVEIQYFDYLLYALQTISDDIATTLYRTAGGQKLPLIIRTRGHRLSKVYGMRALRLVWFLIL